MVEKWAESVGYWECCGVVSVFDGKKKKKREERKKEK
jgi:hypothetical protein